MKRLLLLCVVMLATTPFASAKENPKPIIEGLKSPESVAVGPDGTIYISEIGEFDKDGDGRIAVFKNGKLTTLVDGLDDPKGITLFARWLFVADKTKVLRIDLFSKKVELFAPANAFPTAPLFLNDITARPRKRHDLRQRFRRPQGAWRRRLSHHHAGACEHAREREDASRPQPAERRADGRRLAPAHGGHGQGRTLPHQAGRRLQRKDRRRARRCRRPRLGQLWPALHQRLEGRTGCTSSRGPATSRSFSPRTSRPPQTSA